MSKLKKKRDLTIAEIESIHIVSSRKEINDLKLNQTKQCSRCSLRYKRNPICPASLLDICALTCSVCFYNARNFLNVHKLVKKIRNEQIIKLSKT